MKLCVRSFYRSVGFSILFLVSAFPALAGSRFVPVFTSPESISAWSNLGQVQGAGPNGSTGQVVVQRVLGLSDNGDVYAMGYTSRRAIDGTTTTVPVIFKAWQGGARALIVGGELVLNSPLLPLNAVVSLRSAACVYPFSVDVNDRGDLLITSHFRGASRDSLCTSTNQIIQKGNDAVTFKLKRDGSTEVVSVAQQLDEEFTDHYLDRLGYTNTSSLFSRLFKYGEDASVMFNPGLRSLDNISILTGTAFSDEGQEGYNLWLTKGRPISNLPGYKIHDLPQVVTSQDGKHLYARATIKRDSDTTAIPTLLYLNRSIGYQIKALTAPLGSAAATSLPEFTTRITYGENAVDSTGTRFVRRLSYDYLASVKIGEFQHMPENLNLIVLDDGTAIFSGKQLSTRVLQDFGSTYPPPTGASALLLRLRPTGGQFELDTLLVAGNPNEEIGNYRMTKVQKFNVANDGSVLAIVDLYDARGWNQKVGVIHVDAEGNRHILYHPDVNDLPNAAGQPLFELADIHTTPYISGVLNSNGKAITCIQWTSISQSYAEKLACHYHQIENGAVNSKYLLAKNNPLRTNSSRSIIEIRPFIMDDQDRMILSVLTQNPQNPLNYNENRYHFISVKPDGSLEDVSPSNSNDVFSSIRPFDNRVYDFSPAPVELRPFLRASSGQSYHLNIAKNRLVNANSEIVFLAATEDMRSGYASRSFSIVKLVFDTPTTTTQCPADFDGNGSLGSNDLFSFLAAFQAREARADMTNDNVISLQDLFSFLQKFSAGC